MTILQGVFLYIYFMQKEFRALEVAIPNSIYYRQKSKTNITIMEDIRLNVDDALANIRWKYRL